MYNVLSRFSAQLSLIAAAEPISSAVAAESADHADIVGPLVVPVVTYDVRDRPFIIILVTRSPFSLPLLPLHTYTKCGKICIIEALGKCKCTELQYV